MSQSEMLLDLKIAMRAHPDFHPAFCPGVPALVCSVLAHGTGAQVDARVGFCVRLQVRLMRGLFPPFPGLLVGVC
jgi:hypothetical protein